MPDDQVPSIPHDWDRPVGNPRSSRSELKRTQSSRHFPSHTSTVPDSFWVVTCRFEEVAHRSPTGASMGARR